MKHKNVEKKLQQQRDDLKTYIMFTQGTKAWDELLQTEANIRKQRKAMIYEAQERKEKIILWVGGTSVVIISFAILFAFVYGLWLLDNS